MVNPVGKAKVKTSGPSDNGDRVKSASGFTLVELLLVLMLVALSSSLVAPQLWNGLSKTRERSVVQEFVLALQALRQRSRQEGRMYRLPEVPVRSNQAESFHPFPALPAGWALKKAAALWFLPSGVTNGGALRLRAPSGWSWAVQIRTLDGRVQVERQGKVAGDVDRL